jgi:hypothetical protein
MSLSNRQKLELLKEKKRRDTLENYKTDFESFAKDHIKIITKDSSKGFVPFEFNEPQKFINDALEEQLKSEGKVRAIILKARQQGISTYTAARCFWKAYNYQFQRAVIMAHDAPTSSALFDMTKNLIDNMDDDLKPHYAKSNAKEMKFEHNQSQYKLYTAGSPEAGRGTTPTIAHLSEVAFWTHDEKILAGLFQGISQAENTEVILESTANGASGEFYRLWQGAVEGKNGYIPVFVPWFLTSEYRTPAPEEFELDSEEEKLVSEFGLDNDQLYWRRLKIAESGARKFQQEYPAYAEEAFLVSGSNVFDQETLNDIAVESPKSRRRFNDDMGTWDESKEGELEIWMPPQMGHKYVIGADVALGANQDSSVAIVMDNERRVCALWESNIMDPGTYGEILFYLGRYYNNALLAVESNSIGNTTLDRLIQMNYLNLYYETKVASMRTESTTKLGFRTTASSKPRIIGHLKKLIEDLDINIPSAKIVNELKVYISTDSGKTEAMEGHHDDCVMALAIACEAVRTHGHKLTDNMVSWKDKTNYVEDNSTWL